MLSRHVRRSWRRAFDLSSVRAAAVRAVPGAAHGRGALKVDHLTRLETRTKEFSMVASHWAW
jgi:hypothetical protein